MTGRKKEESAVKYEYITVGRMGRSEVIDRKSRFLGFCAPVDCEEAAMGIVGRLRAEHRDAAHHVWAYRLRGGGARYTDDGEPSGTAGRPVLDTLAGGDIADALTIVVRYFGGTLLGTGGLVHAYGKTAAQALADAQPTRMMLCARVSADMPYALHSRLAAALGSLAVVDETVYGEAVTVRMHLPLERVPALRDTLTRASNGALQIITDGEAWLPYIEETPL